MTEIVHEKIVFNGKLILKKGQIRIGKTAFTREYIDRENAAAILILNTDSDKVVLTQQFRYPVARKVKNELLEIVAGKLDNNEHPLKAAIREAEEETGYKIRKKNIQLLVSCFSTPGYSSEEFFIYYATVTNKDRISKGGGNKDENEYINVIEIKRKKFEDYIKKGKLRDAKTYIAGLQFLLNNTQTNEINMDRGNRIRTGKHTG